MHPTTKNQVYSKESTINSYAWYFQAIPSKFSCATFQKNLQNISHFVKLFLAHGDVVVGFAIFHILIFQKSNKKHSSMVCESWWAPDGIGLLWFMKRKVGRSSKLYKRAQMCQFLSKLA
jgi:hypothetical protein